MKNKPLIFLALAALHIFEPLMKIFYFKVHTGFGFGEVLGNIFSINEPVAIFEFWFLFPIAGFALLGMKKWSYPLFVSTQIYSIYAHLTYTEFTWPYVAETPFMSNVGLLVFNIIVIAYFLLPEVRKPFFDESVRWWETRTRYTTMLPCSLSFNDPNNLEDVDVLNISKSGAFIKYDKPCQVGQPLTIHFTYKDMDIKLHAEVSRVNTFQEHVGLGIHFRYQNIWEDLLMRKIVRTIDKDADKGLLPSLPPAAAA